MKEIIKIHLLLVLLLVCSSSVFSGEDYGCLWWAGGSPYYYNYGQVAGDNIPGDYDGNKQVLCFHTGSYGMAIDTVRLDRIRWGRFRRQVAYEAEIAEVDKLLSAMPESRLSIEVYADGKVYRCTGRSQEKDRKLFGVRFVEYGRYFQHVSINGLIMKDSLGNDLDADCRLEIASWPDVLNMTCYVEGKTVKVSSIVFRVGTKTASEVVSGKDGSLYVNLQLIRAEDHGALEDINIMPVKGAKINIDRSQAHGGYVIKIRDSGWSNKSGTYYPAEHLDRMDKWPFVLKNDSGREKVFRLLFDTPPRNITGFTPMILDREGNPTGIPVQISKNWHRDENNHRYQGPWVHGAAVIRVPPGTTVNYQYAITYARWGGVPAASHAQLSLIGWGHNMFWDQCAIGSFGETICYEPGRTQRRSFITDVRPLMVYDKNGKKWGWTGNVGGGDFLVYFDKAGKYVPMVKTRGRYYSYGPNLTKVCYDEISQDGAIKAIYTVRLARVDDYVRVYHNIRYDVLRQVEFSRLAFCQVPADYYNDMKYGKIAVGNADGMVSQWDIKQGSWKYDRQSVDMSGAHPWVSLHDVLPDENVVQAARGLIVRRWDAVLGSKEIEAPHLSTYMTQWHKGNFRTAVEISPPGDLDKLAPGDFVDMDIELVVLPSKAEDYYGPDELFKAALKKDANTWKIIHLEAAGNNLNIKMEEGRLIKSYPVEIQVSEKQQARFRVAGGVGYVPVTFRGLKDYKGGRLYEVTADGEKVVDQSVDGNAFWQMDYDAATSGWSITYNVKMDSSYKDNETVEFVFK